MAEASSETIWQPAPLRISRSFPVPPETVFKAWSSAEHVSRFFAPSPYTVPAATVEMHVGGTFDVCMRSPEGAEHWSRGTITELVPNRRLVIDFHAVGDDDHKLFRAQTELDFVAIPEGTRLDVVQSYTVFDAAAAAPMIGGASEGWSATIDQLSRLVMGMADGAAAVVRSVVHATFHLERRYDAPIARVWEALTNEGAKSKWFGGSGGQWELLDRHMDIREGGTERHQGRWAGGVVSTFDAIYHDVIPNRRLVYSYVMHLDDRKISASLATIQLSEEGGKTKFAITEQGAFLDGYDDAGSRERGTDQLLDALGASLKD